MPFGWRFGSDVAGTSFTGHPVSSPLGSVDFLNDYDDILCQKFVVPYGQDLMDSSGISLFLLPFWDLLSGSGNVPGENCLLLVPWACGRSPAACGSNRPALCGPPEQGGQWVEEVQGRSGSRGGGRGELSEGWLEKLRSWHIK